MASLTPWRFTLCFAVVLFLASFHASADLGQVIPIGDLERWAAFSLGSEGSGNRLSDNTFVEGDFGAAGNGNITMTDDSTINGDVYYRSNGTLAVAPGATITGSVFNNQNSLLDNGVSEAMAASNAAAAFQSTRSLSEVNGEGTQNIVLSGAPGETVVLNLRKFQLNGDSTLTLQGSANTTYIINVKNQFSLSGNARIVLAGGLDWNDVLFNVRGKGSEVRLSGNSRFEGILLANKRTVRLRDQAIVRGEVIGGRLAFQGTSQVIHPPVVSP